MSTMDRVKQLLGLGNSPKSESELTPALIQARLLHANRERYAIDKQVRLNREFVRGDQWLEKDNRRVSDSVFGTLGRSRTEESKPVYNQIEKIRLLRVAKYTEVPVKWQVISATSETKDIDAAKAASRYIDYWVESRRFRRTFHEAINWVTVDGTCFFQFHVENGKDRFSVLPYHRVSIQPGVDNHQRADYIIVTHKFTISEARSMCEQWGVDPKLLEGSSFVPMMGSELPLVGKQYGRDQRSETMSDYGNDDKFVALFEHYDRTGLVTIATDKQILKQYQLQDYFPGMGTQAVGGIRYPFFKLVEKEVPGQLYGEAMITPLRDPQVALNAISGYSLDYLHRFANPTMLLPVNSVEDSQGFTGEPGQVVEYNPVYGPPQFMAMPSQPMSWFDMRRNILEDMQSLSLTPETLMGVVPGAKDVTGRALALMQSASEAAIAVQIAGMKDVLSEMGYLVLSYAKFVNDSVDVPVLDDTGNPVLDLDGQQVVEQQPGAPIVFKVLGDARVWEAHAFTTAELDPGFTVSCDFGNALEVNRTLREQTIKELFAANMITKPGTSEPDPERALRMLGDVNVVQPYGEESVARARREYFLMAQASSPEQAIPVMPFEDHQVHYSTHVETLRSPDAYELQQSNPIGYDMIVQHTEQHRQFIQQEQMQQLMQSQQQIAGGASPQSASVPVGAQDVAEAGQPQTPIEEADALAREGAAPVINEAMDNANAQPNQQ